MTTNELSQQPENKPIYDFETEQLEETILVAMSNENRSFCLQIENFLIQFIKSPKQKEMLTDLDKFKRKIVHKICERFGVLREYVNVKPNIDLGDITLAKGPETNIPEISLSDLMRKRELDKGKNVTDQTKKKIFQRNQGNQANDGNNRQFENANFNSKEEEFEIQRRNEKYEEIKKRIQIGKNQVVTEQTTDKSKINKLENRQNNNNYDPDYNRNLNRPVPQPMPQSMPQTMFQQPMIPNSMMMPQNMNYNNNFGYQQPQNNNPNFMKFAAPPVYQNFPSNNILNELSYQNAPPMQQNMNPLFNQLGYNNYGMYPNNTPQQMNNQMNLGMFPQQQPQIYNNNFQGNPYGDIRKNNPMAMGNNQNDKKKPIVKNVEKILNEEDFPTLEQANNKN